MQSFKAKMSNLKGDTGKCLKKIPRLEQKAMRQAKKIYQSIDPDFRSAVKETYEDYRQRLRESARAYRVKLAAAPAYQ